MRPDQLFGTLAKSRQNAPVGQQKAPAFCYTLGVKSSLRGRGFEIFIFFLTQQPASKTPVRHTACTPTSILRKQISQLLIVGLIGFPGLVITTGCDRDVAEIETPSGEVEIEEDPLTGERELEVED